jgi:hypothetical protein
MGWTPQKVARTDTSTENLARPDAMKIRTRYTRPASVGSNVPDTAL